MTHENESPGATGIATGAGKGVSTTNHPCAKDTGALVFAQGISNLLAGFLASLGLPLDLRGIAWAMRHALRHREGRG
jgi:hypothetical protein